MTKAAIIISAILVFAGYRSRRNALEQRGQQLADDLDPDGFRPRPATTSGRRIASADDAQGVEDVSGPCDEAEHANDPRCTGAARRGAQDDDGVDDNGHHGQNSGHGGEPGDDNGSSGHGGGNSGHGGGDDD